MEVLPAPDGAVMTMILLNEAMCKEKEKPEYLMPEEDGLNND